MSHRLVVTTLAALGLLGTAFATAAAAAPAKAAVPATPETRLRYSVSLAGIPLARADMTLSTAADHYVSRLVWRTSGLVDVFAGSRGDAAATGQVGAKRTTPATYTLAAGEGRKAVKVVLAMAGGAVKAAEAVPPSRAAADVVPLEPRHRIDVVDPLSAVLLPDKGEGADLCRRTLPIFDGWTRYDIRLSDKGTRPNKRPGITGPIVVCSVRYVPVAGHRAQHNVTRFMSENTDLEVAFGHLEKAGVWVPMQVSVRTMVGTAEVDIETITPVGYDKPAKAAAATP